jgi:hypothetical protein
MIANRTSISKAAIKCREVESSELFGIFCNTISSESSGDSLQFSLRNILATRTVDGVLVQSDPSGDIASLKPLTAHKKVMTVPVLGTTDMSLSRTSVHRPRLSSTAPVHPFLGAPAIPGTKKASGAIQSDPIEIQIRFGASSKWPTDLNATGAARTAMLIQLLDGIDEMKQHGMADCNGFDGLTQITLTYADVGYMGYIFRVFVRADPELKLLRGLKKPSPEAASNLRTLVVSSHHSMVHAVYTRHASSSVVARMAKPWVSSHLLSGMIPLKAVKSLVVKVCSDTGSPLEVPGTVVAGFLRFLYLLANHDWAREPVLVDPQGILTEEETVLITAS